MKRVVITPRLVLDAPTGEVRDALDVRWAPFLAAADVLPMPLPTGVALEPWLASLGPIDGVLLTGGNDVNAVAPAPLNARREETEAALLACLPSAPVFAVCRGFQWLAVRDGYTLERRGGHVATRHRLRSTWAPFDGGEVNSFHQWVVLGEGATLRPRAWAPDGSIEALSDDEGRRVAIAWHPERDASPHPASVALLRSVFR